MSYDSSDQTNVKMAAFDALCTEARQEEHEAEVAYKLSQIISIVEDLIDELGKDAQPPLDVYVYQSLRRRLGKLQ